MLMLVGASLSLAGLAACRRPVEEIVPYVDAPEEIVPGVPRYYATTMPFGRSAYGLIVESHEGRPTKVEGNQSHPVDARRVELAHPGVGARSLRSRPLAVGHCSAACRSPGRTSSPPGRTCPRGTPRMAAPASRSSQSRSPRPPWRGSSSELRGRYPRLQWATYDAVSDENRLAGLRQAAGRDLDLRLRFDRASVILALDADLLLTDPEMIRHARGFADGRRARRFRRRDEPALRRRRHLLADRDHGRSPAPPDQPPDRPVRRGARRPPRGARRRWTGRRRRVRASTRDGSTRWPRTFSRIAARA